MSTPSKRENSAEQDLRRYRDLFGRYCDEIPDSIEKTEERSRVTSGRSILSVAAETKKRRNERRKDEKMTETTLTDAEVRRDRHLRKIALIDDLRDAIADLEQLDVRIDGDEDHPAEMAMVYIADEIEAVAKRLVELSQE